MDRHFTPLTIKPPTLGGLTAILDIRRGWDLEENHRLNQTMILEEASVLRHGRHLDGSRHLNPPTIKPQSGTAAKDGVWRGPRPSVTDGMGAVI